MKSTILSSLLIFFAVAATAQTWEELSNQVSDLYGKKEFEKAIPLAEKAIQAAKREFGDSSSKYAYSLADLGELYYSLQQYEKVEPLFVQANVIRRKVLGENHSDYAQSLNSLADLYKDMGQYKKAEPLYLQTIELRRKILGENHEDYAESLNGLAILYYYMGKYERSEPLYMQAKNIWKKTLGETNLYYAESLNNLAALYDEMGLYEKAEPIYTEAVAIKKKIFGENSDDYAESLDNLAVVYSDMGKFDKAEPLLLQANEIYKKEKEGNRLGYAISLSNLGVFYVSLGQYDKAELLYTTSLEILRRGVGEGHPDYISILKNLASLYFFKKQNDKGEQLMLRALTSIKKVFGDGHVKYAGSLNSMASFYKDIGKYDKAEPCYIQALEIIRKTVGDNHVEYARSLSGLGALYFSMQRYDKAEPLFIRAIEARKKMLGENHIEYASSLSKLAGLYEATGKLDKAESLYLKNTQIIVQNLLNNFTILSEKEKGNYIINKISIQESTNSFAYNNKNVSASFIRSNYDQQLFFKSLILTDTKKMLGFIQNSSDSSVAQTFNEWRKDKSLLAKQYALPIIKRRPDLDSIESSAEMLEKKLSRLSSAFHEQQASFRITMKEVQNNLDEDEAAIEFVQIPLTNKKKTDSIIYAAYILRKNDTVPRFVPLFEEKQLDSLSKRYGKTATQLAKAFYRGVDTINNKGFLPGESLYQLVWQPMERYLTGINKIAYSPAGKLYAIAFHALAVDSTKILMDKYRLQQYTSTREIALRSTKRENTRPAGIVLFGDANFSMDSLQLTKGRSLSSITRGSTTIYTPVTRNAINNSWPSLPGTASEVKTIADLFKRNKIPNESFTQAGASEENLKALNGKSPGVIHIATHGYFLPAPDTKKDESGLSNAYTLANDPLLRSGLILSGGNYAWSGKKPVEGIEDGIATAYEISQLNLSNTELIVLSACETALGDIKGNEGVFGLQRAFKMAGVKKMLVSLWQVPDKETAELMISFYTNWMNGKTINEAFALAQSGMRKKYPPYFWAGFELVE